MLEVCANQLLILDYDFLQEFNVEFGLVPAVIDLIDILREPAFKNVVLVG